MRDRPGTACRYPLPVRSQRGFDVRFFQELRRSVPLHSLKLPQFSERNDRGHLTTQMDHLVRARVTGWVCGHGNTVPRSSDIHGLRLTSQLRQSVSPGKPVVGPAGVTEDGA